ncbi:MAG: radical SAM protein [Polyangiales bacterium]
MSADGTTAAQMLGRLEANGDRPLRAMLEISDRCNEVCVHCYQVQGQKGELTTTEWRRALDELAELGVLILTLSGGEATLRPDFLEIVEYARARGFLVRVFTNGLRMTAELAAALRRLAVFDVEISVYSTRAEVHDFVTGVPGSFEKTVAGVRHLSAAGVPVTIKTSVMSVNQADLAGYAEFAGSLGAQWILDPTGLMPREGMDRAPEALNPDGAAVTRLARQYELDVVLAASSEPDGGRAAADEMLCGAAQQLHVEPNGELRPCTMLEVPLGNVRAAGALASFQSPTARGMRALRWGDVHGCRECDLARHCARCHAAALAETGDALAPYPSACARARLAASSALVDSELRIIATNGRTAALGPYRRVSPGVYETIEDRLTDEDRARAQHLGWVRHAGATQAAPELAVRPGELVQIRRPGRKSPGLERVPGGPARSTR